MKGGKNYYTMTEELTEKQAEDMLRQISEGKQNMHSFFTKVIKSDSTTRVGNIDEDEGGIFKIFLS